MKKFSIITLLALALLAYACKNQPAAHAATVPSTDTLAEPAIAQASDTLHIG